MHKLHEPSGFIGSNGNGRHIEWAQAPTNLFKAITVARISSKPKSEKKKILSLYEA